MDHDVLIHYDQREEDVHSGQLERTSVPPSWFRRLLVSAVQPFINISIVFTVAHSYLKLVAS